MSRREQRRLQPEFFRRDARQVAPELLGQIIQTEFDGVVTSGRITEVEAYRQDDPASHCYGGQTGRNRPMYLDGGHVYVYFIYGMHYCANIVCGEPGFGEAVLLRGIEPLEGIEMMRRRRGPNVRERDLSNGPAKLVEALGIGPEQNGIDATTPDSPILLLQAPQIPPDQITTTPRIGISKGVDLLWRWVSVK